MRHLPFDRLVLGLFIVVGLVLARGHGFAFHNTCGDGLWRKTDPNDHGLRLAADLVR